MYDQVRVIFVDRTETVIYVHEDEDIQQELAKLTDEEGVAVWDYSIEGQVEEAP